MKRDYELVKLISYYFNNEPIPDDMCWESLVNSAKKHGLQTMLYEIIKKKSCIPKEIKLKAENQYQAMIWQQIQQDYYAECLFEELKKRDIPFVVLKGHVLRHLYPYPELRTSCDVDVLYDSNRANEIPEVMEMLGFNLKDEWTRGVVTIEMHPELDSFNETCKQYYANPWQRIIKREDGNYLFSDEDFYVYFLVHAVKHFLVGGFGIRTVLDIYVFNREKKNLNFEYLNSELDKLGLREFNEMIKKLAFVWFGKEDEDESTIKIGEYVMFCGTYGKIENQALMRVIDEKKTTKSMKIKYFFLSVFPPYSRMIIKYNWLRKVPFLLPVAWIMRFFGAIFFRRKNIKTMSRNIASMSDDKVNLVNDVLRITNLDKVK